MWTQLPHGLACRLPLVVANNISLLASHLGGKAYPIRSAIVTAIGHLIHKAFEPSAAGADAQGDASCCCILHILHACPESCNALRLMAQLVKLLAALDSLSTTS